MNKASLTGDTSFFADAITLADPSWHEILRSGFAAMEAAIPGYLSSLNNTPYLPTRNRLFAAFSVPLAEVRYVLIGEGPYPREVSATGVCFMDGAVQSLWSMEEGGGLSKPVNRATSLRNFIKMLLVADGCLSAANTSGSALAHISVAARAPDSELVKTLPELQANMMQRGFLLLNASLVFRHDVPPAKDAAAWQPLLNVVFCALQAQQEGANSQQVTLVLWGKIAEQSQKISAAASLAQIVSEHPYNLSFIANPTMLKFFAPLRLLLSAPKDSQHDIT